MRTACCLTLLLTVPALRAADEAVTFGKGPAKGSKYITRTTVKFENVAVTVKVNGKQAAQYSESSEQKREIELEILQVKDARVDKLRFKITGDEKKTTRKAGGKSTTTKSSDPLLGLAVLCVRTKAGWKNTLEKGKPGDKQQQRLDDKTFIDPGGEVFPGKAVKVGDTWKVNPGAFGKFLGAKIRIVGGKAVATFKKVESLQGERCVVVEVEVDVKGKTEAGGLSGTLAVQGTWTICRALRSGMNLKETFKGTIEAEMTGKNKNGDETTLSTSGNLTAEDVTEAAKK